MLPRNYLKSTLRSLYYGISELRHLRGSLSGSALIQLLYLVTPFPQHKHMDGFSDGGKCVLSVFVSPIMQLYVSHPSDLHTVNSK